MTITPGLCACGCGGQTKINAKTDTANGWIKGEPRKWLRGHDKRKHPHGAACQAPGCDRTPEARGLCHSHFEWSRRNAGAIPTDGTILTTDLERFEAKVKKLPSGHWIWTGATSGDGDYGTATYQGRTMGAHRVAWLLYRGPLLPGYAQVIDHVCRKTLCVNPDHLEPTTMKINTMRGDAPSAANGAKTHCIHGHPFEGDNLITRPNGDRDCRACARRRGRESSARYRARQRAAAR